MATNPRTVDHEHDDLTLLMQLASGLDTGVWRGIRPEALAGADLPPRLARELRDWALRDPWELPPGSLAWIFDDRRAPMRFDFAAFADNRPREPWRIFDDRRAPQPVSSANVVAPPLTRKSKGDIAARRALQEFDEHLAVFNSKYPTRPTSEVTVDALAKDRHVDRQKYYRLLIRAGSRETALQYIQRRLPEIRGRMA